MPKAELYESCAILKRSSQKPWFTHVTRYLGDLLYLGVVTTSQLSSFGLFSLDSGEYSNLCFEVIFAHEVSPRDKLKTESPNLVMSSPWYQLDGCARQHRRTRIRSVTSGPRDQRLSRASNQNFTAEMVQLFVPRIPLFVACGNSATVLCVHHVNAFASLSC